MDLNKIKEMKRIIKILLIASVLLIAFLSFSLYRNFTGEVVRNYHSYTKAICNETNFCQDYEIICDGENLINTNPISGASVQNSDDWKDPRPEDERNMNRLCNISQ